MAVIKFSTEEKDQLVIKIQKYFDVELSQDIGQFDAEFLLDFFSNEVGAYFYNRALNDAQLIFSNQLENISDSITEAISEIEKPVA